MKRVAVGLVTCGLVGGCGGGDAITLPGDAKGTVEAVVSHLGAGRPAVLWAALPPSYRDDVTALARAFGAGVDPELYDESFDLARRVVGLLRTKKELILAHPMIASQVDSDVEAGWDAFVGMLDAIVSSDLADSGKLAQIDVGAFLATDGARFMEHLRRGASQSADDPLAKLRGMTVDVLTSSADRAKLSLSTPGESPSTLELKRVEGRWLPVDMVDDWSSEVARMRERIDAMAASSSASSTQARMFLTLAGSAVSQLEQANTEEEFAEVVEGLLGMAMGAPPRGR